MKSIGNLIFQRIESLQLKSVYEELHSIDAKHMKHAWSLSAWEELACEFDHYEIFVVMDDQIQAFALYSMQNSPQAHLLKIVTTKEYRSKGVGLELMKMSFEYLKIKRAISDIYLEVESENMKAIRFYESFGFEQIHTKKQFYSDGSDALIMQLKAK